MTEKKEKTQEKKYKKLDPIMFESQLELCEMLRDKSKDFQHKETEEFKKNLSINRAKNKHYVFVTPNGVFK